MPIKPYSFRYPYNIETTLERWAQKMASALTGGDLTIPHLSDRDRSLEDYLSLGIGQGILARATVTSSQAGIGAGGSVITGTPITINVPAGRLIQFDGQVQLINDSAVNTIATVQIQETPGPTIIMQRQAPLTPTGTIGNFADLSFTHFLAPTVGSHTYQLVAFFSGGNGTVFASASAPTLFFITDIGPAN